MDKKKIYFLRGITNSPFFNIASEEYLLRQTDGYYIYLWINSPAVIVGVNQNTAEEVNLDYTAENGVKVVRRQTGGGAVYHDLNNVCYTIIDDYDGERDNYRYFTEGITEYLGTLGVKAEFSGRNDLVVDGKKISGNAQCVYKKRMMHHGTLLFDTDAAALTCALKPHRLKAESKGIKSARARITNISEHLPQKMTTAEFFEGLAAYFSKTAEPREFTADDIRAINALVKEKYSTFGWNVGASPSAKFTAEKKFPYGLVQINFGVEEGRLKDVKIYGDFFSVKDINPLNHALNGILYKRDAIEKALCGVGECVVGSTPREIAEMFFE
ncbi:MAG: lipoate--protein ligase [Clostridia bacterium]|nr:lipoate--protein ligase [Clostridia bacterium]